jgi:hypothetical protein
VFYGKYCPSIFPERLRKNTKKPGLRFKPTTSPEYEAAGVPRTGSDVLKIKVYQMAKTKKHCYLTFYTTTSSREISVDPCLCLDGRVM